MCAVRGEGKGGGVLMCNKMYMLYFMFTLYFMLFYMYILLCISGVFLHLIYINVSSSVVPGSSWRAWE